MGGGGGRGGDLGGGPKNIRGEKKGDQSSPIKYIGDGGL